MTENEKHLEKINEQLKEVKAKKMILGYAGNVAGAAYAYNKKKSGLSIVAYSMLGGLVLRLSLMAYKNEQEKALENKREIIKAEILEEKEIWKQQEK